MDNNNTKKNTVAFDPSLLSDEQMDRMLKSAKKTRKKVRENIKNDTLPEIPKEIDSFLSEEVA